MTSTTLRRGLAALALAAAPAAARAHIVFAEPSAPAGSHHAGFLRVSHGCAGSATVAIRVAIPAEVASARPQPKPGWTLAIETASPAAGKAGRVTAITWTGRLEADRFDQFGLLLDLPDRPGPLYFPTVQRCAVGTNAWTAIPAAGQAWHSLAFPAPVLTVTPAGAAEGAMKM